VRAPPFVEGEAHDLVLPIRTLRGFNTPRPLANPGRGVPSPAHRVRCEGAPRPVGARGAASLAFVGPVATAFAYWAVVETGRHFSAGTADGMGALILATVAPPICLRNSGWDGGWLVFRKPAPGTGWWAV